MNDVRIEDPKRPPLAETPLDRRFGDISFFDWHEAIKSAVRRSKRLGVHQQVHLTYDPQWRRDAWVVQDVR
jgi:hypothetical protein